MGSMRTFERIICNPLPSPPVIITDALPPPLLIFGRVAAASNRIIRDGPEENLHFLGRVRTRRQKKMTPMEEIGRKEGGIKTTPPPPATAAAGSTTF